MRPSHLTAARLVVLVLCAVTLAAGCSPGSTLSAGSATTTHASTHVTVAIRDYSFDPANVTVATGGTITFVNDDKVAHTATAPDGAFDTGTIVPGKSVTVHVGSASKGQVPYICDIHQFMTATVTVVP